MTSNSKQRPNWLAELDELSSSRDLDDRDRDALVFVRELLHAPEEDKDVTIKTIHAVQAYYRDEFDSADDLFWKADTAQVIGSIGSMMFRVSEFVPFDHIGHKRVGDLLVGLKRSAAHEFISEDPRLGFDDRFLVIDARETWDACHLDETDGVDKCSTKLSMFTLLARLTGGDALGGYGLMWAGQDVIEGLEKPRYRNSSTLVLNTAAAIATQYILWAGEVLVSYAKTHNSPEGSDLDEGRWRVWAAKLKDIATMAPADAEWDLKANAQRAYVKMVELWPELFEGETEGAL